MSEDDRSDENESSSEISKNSQEDSVCQEASSKKSQGSTKRYPDEEQKQDLPQFKEQASYFENEKQDA